MKGCSIFVCLLAGACVTATGAALADQPEKGTFSVLFENDVFYHLDRDYTNGVQFAWTDGPDDTPDWAIATARLLPFFPQSGVVRTTYALGQNIYTPHNIALKNPRKTDEPYAGWLYGSIGLNSETGNRLDQLQLQVGVVGPASLARQTQTIVHELLGDQKPEGWDYQLHNEPGLVLTYVRSWRALQSGSLAGLAYDLTPDIGAAVGNVYDYANVGIMARLGINLPDDYGPPRIEPSLPGSGFFEPSAGFGWYFFAGLEGRAVARDIFLDGNTWTESRHVEKEPFVGDAEFGLATTIGNTRIAYTHVFRSREFRTEQHAHQFGAISASFRF